MIKFRILHRKIPETLECFRLPGKKLHRGPQMAQVLIHSSYYYFSKALPDIGAQGSLVTVTLPCNSKDLKGSSGNQRRTIIKRQS